MISYYRRKIGEEKIKKLSSFQIGSWVSVVDPSEEEIKYLWQKFKLDKRNLYSGLDENEIPRLDFIGSNIYVFNKDILPSRKIQTILIVIGKKFILTLSKQEPSFQSKILGEKVEFFTTQKLKCLIKILFLINESLEKDTIKIVKDVQITKLSKKELTEKNLEELLEKEDFLNGLVSSYQYMRLVYERAIKRIPFFREDKELLEDLIEETNQGFNLCKSSLKTISNIRKYYDILLSNKLNKIITILTIFTVLISLPAAISGIYGMNIALPFQKNPLAFWYIVGIILIAWILFIVYLRKNKII